MMMKNSSLKPYYILYASDGIVLENLGMRFLSEVQPARNLRMDSTPNDGKYSYVI